MTRICRARTKNGRLKALIVGNMCVGGHQRSTGEESARTKMGMGGFLLLRGTPYNNKGASVKDVTRDTGGVGSMRSVTYCERDVTYRGGGSDAERDKGIFAREMHYGYCPELVHLS